MNTKTTKTTTIEGYLLKTANTTFRKRAICADGFSVSIQQGPGFHGSNAGLDVEVGYPKNSNMDSIMELEMLTEYKDGEDPVWAFVPIRVMDQLLAIHGGIVI